MPNMIKSLRTWRDEAMYKEIIELYNYCKSNNVECALQPLFDGFKLCLPDNGDFVQHMYSYGSGKGMVEPAIGCNRDYRAISLVEAEILILKYYIKEV